MPIYEFECQSCGTRFDRLQKLSDPDPTECPNCTKPNVRKCVTAPAFRLAGSGWYETDFKGDKDKKKNLAGAADPAASAKTETKTENSSITSTPAAATTVAPKPSGTTPSS